jgi:hypothetical protein
MQHVSENERRVAKIFLLIIICIYTIRGLENLIFADGISEAVNIIFEGLSVLAYFLFFPVIAVVPARQWAKTAGYIWLILDIMATTMPLYGVAPEVSLAVRLGGAHMATAVWIAGVSYENTASLKLLGYVLVVLLVGYSFIKLWIPPYILDYFFLILIPWYILLLRFLMSKK